MSVSDGRLKRQHRFTVTPEHLILDPRVSDRAFRLWCRLDRFAGDREVAFPTNETLAVWLDCDPSSVARARKELVDAGWLLVEPRTGTSNLYTLVVAKVELTKKFIDAAIAKREAETQERRDKKKARRKAGKQAARASVKSSADEANEQVSGGGVSTGAHPPTTMGVSTGEYPPVSTGAHPGVSTGADQKEATPEGSNTEGPLLSPSADAEDDVKSEPGHVDREDVTRVCQHLQQRIRENGYKPDPRITVEWRRTARLMLDRDGRTEQQLHNMIEWATNDEFWRPNIRSMGKLREHYDKMRERAIAERAKAEQAAATPRRGDIDWTAAMERAVQMDERLEGGGGA
jgi:hypothetical protein